MEGSGRARAQTTIRAARPGLLGDLPGLWRAHSRGGVATVTFGTLTEQRRTELETADEAAAAPGPIPGVRVRPYGV